MTAALGLDISRGRPGPGLLARLVTGAAAHARPIAIGQLLLAVASAGVSLVLWAGQRFAPPPMSFVTTALPIAVQMPMYLAYALVGAVLAARRPGNPIGWLFLAIGLTSSFVPAIDFLVADAGHGFTAPPTETLVAAWLVSSFHLPMLCALVIVVFLIFPDGRPLAGPWWLAAWAAIGGAILVGIGLALDPSGLRWYPTLPNPTAAPAWARSIVLAVQAAGLIGILTGLGLSIAAMTIRFRRYSPAERHQLVWIWAAVLALATSGGALLVVRYGIGVSPAMSETVLVITLACAGLVPVAAALGMLRHRLFDVELILNHALVYVPLTGFLAGLYAASVALFTRLFVLVTGDSSDVVIVLATLVLAGTFSPLRKALEGFVDRHFKPASPAEGEPADAGPAPAGRRAARRARPDGQAAAIAELRELQARMARLEEQLAGSGAAAAPETGTAS